MVDITPRVLAALRQAHPNVAYAYPQNWAALPQVSYYLLEDAEAARAANREYLSRIAYQVDVWADSPAAVSETALRIDRELARIGLQREYAGDLYDSAAQLHHRTLRYAAAVKRDGAILELGGY